MKCKIDGCCNNALDRYSHGMCSKHYLQVLSCGKTYKTKYEEKREAIEARNAEIIQLLKDGISRSEIRKRYNISRDSLKWIVKQSGDDSLKIDQALTTEQIAQKLIDNGLQFEYAGEYKRGSHVLLRCKVCGEVVRYSCAVLYKKHLQCKECKRMEREQAKKQKAEKAAAKDQARADAVKKKVMQHEARRREVVCPVCGETFVTYKAKQNVCSPECRRKHNNRMHSHRKDTRISKDKRIDKISLDVLFQRDHGICHICGKQCDWNDYTQTDTAFIAGNLYPSIDHIIPVSLGGEDSWNNVKLAHRICNSIKSDNAPY